MNSKNLTLAALVAVFGASVVMAEGTAPAAPAGEPKKEAPADPGKGDKKDAPAKKEGKKGKKGKKGDKKKEGEKKGEEKAPEAPKK